MTDSSTTISLGLPCSTVALHPDADAWPHGFNELFESEDHHDCDPVVRRRSSLDLDRQLSAQLGLGCASPALFSGPWDTSADAGDCLPPLDASRGSSGGGAADDSGICLTSLPACAPSPSPAPRPVSGKLAAQRVGRDVAPLPRSTRPSISAPSSGAHQQQKQKGSAVIPPAASGLAAHQGAESAAAASPAPFTPGYVYTWKNLGIEDAQELLSGVAPSGNNKIPLRSFQKASGNTSRDRGAQQQQGSSTTRKRAGKAGARAVPVSRSGVRTVLRA